MQSSSPMEIAPWRIRSLTKLVYSQPFELLIAFVILINATSLAILTMPELDPQVRDACEQIDLICFAIYGAELVLRILSYGKKPWMFFRQGWNIFDFIVIAASPLLSGQTAVLRLLRLLRLVRIFRFLPEVRVLTTCHPRLEISLETQRLNLHGNTWIRSIHREVQRVKFKHG